MVRLFTKSRDSAVAVERDPADIATARSDSDWVWLDVANPSEDDVREFGRQFDLDPLSLQDVLDVTLLPKADDHGDYLFVVIHGMIAEGGERLATEELDLFVGRDFLVTAHRTRMVAVDWIAEHVVASERVAGSGVAGIAAAIAEAVGRRYLSLLDALDERIDGLEENAIVADPVTLTETHALRRDVIVLRRVLGPQRDVLRQLAWSNSPVIGESARRSFSDVYDHHFRLVESLDAGRALLAAVLDTYRGAVAERTNEVMKVLTVFSAILLPLGLIAGLWGMNFSEIPASGWRWGFVALLGLMAVLATGLWVSFARRGFVGQPKLRDLPKSVGLGLIHIGAAPLRIVTGFLDPRRPEDSRRDDEPPGSGAPRP